MRLGSCRGTCLVRVRVRVRVRVVVWVVVRVRVVARVRVRVRVRIRVRVRVRVRRTAAVRQVVAEVRARGTHSLAVAEHAPGGATWRR